MDIQDVNTEYSALTFFYLTSCSKSQGIVSKLASPAISLNFKVSEYISQISDSQTVLSILLVWGNYSMSVQTHIPKDSQACQSIYLCIPRIRTLRMTPKSSDNSQNLKAGTYAI